MSAALLKKQFESELGGLLDWQSRPAPETVPTGIPAVDGAIGGLPRGSLTEIFGPASSGRTSLLISILATATARQESCALVDASDAFDPASAEAAGVRLERVLWIRCGHNAEHALKAVDLLIQGGGFGLVAMDLGDTPPAIARHISMVSWFRLRRAVEYTPTVLVTLARQSNAKTCASLMLECAREGVDWTGAWTGKWTGAGDGTRPCVGDGARPYLRTGAGDGAWPCSRLLRGMSIRVARRKPSATGAAHVLLPLW